ncbi:MAG: hypothetical protein ACT4P1_14450 [Sporichthyaceae bacterium]
MRSIRSRVALIALASVPVLVAPVTLFGGSASAVAPPSREFTGSIGLGVAAPVTLFKLCAALTPAALLTLNQTDIDQFELDNDVNLAFGTDLDDMMIELVGPTPPNGDRMIFGFGGDDVIAGTVGNDYVCAGEGDDVIVNLAGDNEVSDGAPTSDDGVLGVPVPGDLVLTGIGDDRVEFDPNDTDLLCYSGIGDNSGCDPLILLVPPAM